MPIRILTVADAPAIQQIAQDARPAGVAFGAASLFESQNRFIVVGDPSVPALVRLEHYQLDAGTLAHFPPALAALITTAGGWQTMVTDFYPLAIAAPGGAARVAAALKFLATVLKALPEKAPAGAVRTALLTRPVWARFHPVLVDFMVHGVPAAGILAPFPAAGFDDQYIWHGRLRDARDAVSSLAVNV